MEVVILCDWRNQQYMTGQNQSRCRGDDDDIVLQINKYLHQHIINELCLLLLLVMNLQVNHDIQRSMRVLFQLERQQVHDHWQVFQMDEQIFYLLDRVLLVRV